MKISFHINFHTVWGQVLYITGSIPELGNWDNLQAKEMNHSGNGDWTLEIELPDQPVRFEYRYFLLSNGQQTFEEWQRNHQIEIREPYPDYLLVDYWQNRPRNQAYYSSAFINCWFAHPCDKFERVVRSGRKLIIKVLAPGIRPDQSLAILGNQCELGDWDPDKALIMACDRFPEWYVELDANRFSFPVEYKFCVLDNEKRALSQWEKGENRTLYVPFVRDKSTMIVSGLEFRNTGPEWRCAGTVIPVFSLRSSESFGIGDFADLKRVVDWLRLTSQRVLQLLPVNDTTKDHSRKDSYPYEAVSIYALHPIYLNLNQIGKLKKRDRQAFFDKKQIELNRRETVDYEETDRLKWHFFREIYEQEGEDTLLSPEFQLFFSENREWLVPYAAYSFLRDRYQTPDFRLWERYGNYNQQEIEALCAPDSPSYTAIALYYFLQYHLNRQLTDARNYANSRGIILKGDIPIGISRNSVEAWKESRFFRTEFQTGAPPDDFSPTGQNWGFPIYNWEEMEADRYRWWEKRFRKMADYFDAYRIDHILGFFRIWKIPVDSVQGLLGYFDPALPFSLEEIENSGLKFERELFTRAFVHSDSLADLFGGNEQEICRIYLERGDSRLFYLKEEFNTQQKIRQFFSDKEDERSKKIRDGLYALCNEVLFIEDDKRPDHFHPRITAASTWRYKNLDKADKYAFDFLYWNYFYQRHNEFWKDQGYRKLTPLIAATDMLACGEDLGMIPHSVPEVMKKLQILSLEIERMPKESNIEFTPLGDLPYLSVCMTSTHDMSTLREWWRENREKTQEYYNHILNREGKAPEVCTPEVCRQIIDNHLRANSLLTIIPLQDWMAIDAEVRRKDEKSERINTPSDPDNYWNYRMHITLEELISCDQLNKEIITLIGESGR